MRFDFADSGLDNRRKRNGMLTWMRERHIERSLVFSHFISLPALAKGPWTGGHILSEYRRREPHDVKSLSSHHYFSDASHRADGDSPHSGEELWFRRQFWLAGFEKRRS
jgi:hypothetical protein